VGVLPFPGGDADWRVIVQVPVSGKIIDIEHPDRGFGIRPGIRDIDHQHELGTDQLPAGSNDVDRRGVLSVARLVGLFVATIAGLTPAPTDALASDPIEIGDKTRKSANYGPRGAQT
jgi:hypothetical protein